MDKFKNAVADAALNASLAGIQTQFPEHKIEVVTRTKLQLQVRIKHPGDQRGPRYFLLKVSEPL